MNKLLKMIVSAAAMSLSWVGLAAEGTFSLEAPESSGDPRVDTLVEYYSALYKGDFEHAMELCSSHMLALVEKDLSDSSKHARMISMARECGPQFDVTSISEGQGYVALGFKTCGYEHTAYVSTESPHLMLPSKPKSE